MDFSEYATKKLGGIEKVRRDYIRSRCNKDTKIEDLCSVGLGDLTIDELLFAIKGKQKRRTKEEVLSLHRRIEHYLRAINAPVPAREMSEDLGEEMQVVTRALATLVKSDTITKIGDRFNAKWAIK